MSTRSPETVPLECSERASPHSPRKVRTHASHTGHKKKHLCTAKQRAGIALASGPSCPSTKQLGSAPCSDSAPGARSAVTGPRRLLRRKPRSPVTSSWTVGVFALARSSQGESRPGLATTGGGWRVGDNLQVQTLEPQDELCSERTIANTNSVIRSQTCGRSG